MRKMMLVLLVLVVAVPVLVFAQDDQSTMSCLEYLDMRQADVDNLTVLMNGSAEFSGKEAVFFEVVSLRRKYEDIAAPDCAVNLNRLMTMQLSTIQDGITALVFSALSSEPYDDFTADTAVRMATIKANIAAEEASIRVGLDSPGEADTPSDSTEDVVATAAGTRTDPIPFGQYYQFDKGKFRVVSVIDPYEGGFFDPEEGNRAIAVSVEYVCEEQDPNVSCTALDLFPSTAVLNDGAVIESLSMVGDEPYYINAEGFAGTTLAGNIYLEVPANAVVVAIRGYDMSDFDEIYFSLVAQ